MDLKEIMGRTDIRAVSSYLLNGIGEPGELDTRPYQQRVEEDESLIFQCLQKLCPNEDKLSEVADLLNTALTTSQEVYFEVGIKAGARLSSQLLQGDCQLAPIVRIKK